MVWHSEVLYRQGWHVTKHATEEEAYTANYKELDAESWNNNPNPPRDHRVVEYVPLNQDPIAPVIPFDETEW